MSRKPLRVGDQVKLMAPRYGEPDGVCTVIADQEGGLVWFRASEPTSQDQGPCFVARRTEVKVIRRKHSTEESRS